MMNLSFISTNMFMILMLISSFWIFLSNFILTNKMIYIFSFTIIKLKSINWSFIIIMDFYSIFFLMTILYISLFVYNFSDYYMKNEKKFSQFHFFMLIFIISMILLIISPNLFSLIIGWDGLGLSSFILVIFYNNNKAINAGLLTMFTNRLGDMFLIFSLSLTLINTNFCSSQLLMPMILLTMASFTKSAQIPFSAWLPAAMAAPTPVSSLVHSSTLVTAGIYLLIRFNESIFINNFLIQLLFFSGIVTMLMAGISANYENDFKKIVAFSTLSQMGLMIMSLNMKIKIVVFFHLLIHAFFKAMLFLSIGVYIHESKNYQNMKFMQYFNFNLFMLLTLMSNLALIGIPFISGHSSKDMILEFFLISKFSVFNIFLFFLSLFLTLSYSVRFLKILFMKFYNKQLIYNLQFKLNKPMFSVFFMWIIVIYGGLMMNWIFPWNQHSPMIFFFFKLIIIIFIGVNLFILFISMKMMNLMNKIFISDFSSMWNLMKFTSPLMSFFFLKKSKMFFLEFDSKWIYEMSFIMMKILFMNNFFKIINYKNNQLLKMILTIMCLNLILNI